MRLKIIWQTLKEIFASWSEDNVSSLSAALAYYMIFSIAPLLIICIAIVGVVFGKEAAQGHIIHQISAILGREGAQQIQIMLVGANKPLTGTITSLISLALLFFGASGVFAELQYGLNRIWGVTSKSEAGWITVIKNRFLSFTMVLCIAFLLLVSLIINAFLTAVSNKLDALIPSISFYLFTINFLISFGVITALFAMILKILPNADIRWGDVWIGSIVTGLLFMLGKLVIEIYLGTSSVHSIYGAAGSLIVILIWVYYSAQILFLGAEFTKVYAKILARTRI